MSSVSRCPMCQIFYLIVTVTVHVQWFLLIKGLLHLSGQWWGCWLLDTSKIIICIYTCGAAWDRNGRHAVSNDSCTHFATAALILREPSLKTSGSTVRGQHTCKMQMWQHWWFRHLRALPPRAQGKHHLIQPIITNVTYRWVTARKM